MRGPRRWTTPSRAWLFASLFLVVGILLVPTSSASGLLLWKAPYSGSLHSEHHNKFGSCATGNFGGLHLDRSNGHVTGAASVSSDAACNPMSSSLANVDASVALTLPSFSGRSGNYTVLVKWKLDFKVDLTISGSNCQSGTYAVTSIGFGMLVDNVSNGTPAASDAHSFLFKLTTVGTATHLISKNVTVKIDMVLDSSVSYEVVPGVTIALGSDAPPPAAPATSTCTADATLKDGSSSGIAVLASVAVL
jgi:hypothetical protein